MTSKIDSLMVSFLIINDKKTLLALAPKFGAIVQGGIYTLRSWTDMVPGTASTLFLGLPQPCLDNRNLNFGGGFNKVRNQCRVYVHPIRYSEKRSELEEP